MEAAEQGKPVRQFQTPSAYPVYKPFTKGYWGYLAIPVAPTPVTTTTVAGNTKASTTVITQQAPSPAHQLGQGH
jgi:hypothetical protein